MPVQIDKIEWGGWPNCYRMSNGEAELVVTSDVGPRIMRYGFAGGQNFFKVFQDQLGRSGEKTWQFRGGHRIWIGPEHRERSYGPDNEPAEIQVRGEVLTATQKTEPSTGIQKQLVIRLAERGSGVEVLNRMKNTLPFPIQFAAWAVSMMAENGTAVSGFPPRARHEDALSPTHPLIMWAFTDLRDPRWKLLRKYLVLHQDPGASEPTKLGHFNVNTWGAYFLGSDMFLKRCAAEPGLPYPDLGCSFETFANRDMLEIETLGPIRTVEPGEWLEHTELWSLHRDVTVDDWTDDNLDAALSGVQLNVGPVL